MGLPEDDPLRRLPPEELATLLDDVIASWGSDEDESEEERWKAAEATYDRKTSAHFELHMLLACIAKWITGRSVTAGEPVPLCICPVCEGGRRRLSR